jgi:hypothetical protein
VTAGRAPTLIDVGVDSELVEKGSSQKYFAISARVGEFDCVLLDTLNCHHCLTEEEQQSVAEEFARRYKAHDPLVAWIETHGSHPNNCGKWIHGPRGSVLGDWGCTCGLDAALKAAKVPS